MPFWGFRADFDPQNEGQNQPETPQKGIMQLNYAWKSVKKLRRLDCVSATQFLYAFSAVVQCHIVNIVLDVWLKLVMCPGIPEPENSRPNPSFFHTRQTRTRLFKFREFPYPPEPDFFRTRPISSS